MYDLIIVGSGPAGMSAALYAKRAMLNVLVLEKEYVCGGQIVNAEKVDNYLGLNNISGMELSSTFRKHMEKHEIPARQGEVSSIITEGEVKKIILTDGSELETKTILIATGSNHKALGVNGERKLVGAGVSYCATCDGAFFRGRDVAVVGGGNVAIADAIYLSRIAKHVTLIHRREGYRADKILIDSLKKTDNITEMLNYEVDEIVGGGTVKEILVHNNQTGEKEKLPVAGVFIAVGMLPQTYFLGDEIEVKDGYIVAGEDCKTNVPGIFAAGDVRTKKVRQLVTAVADGATAIASVEEYLTTIN